MAAIRLPDTIQPRDGPTNFSTYAIEDTKLYYLAHHCIRVSQGDALRVTKFGMQQDDATYHRALVTIIATKTDLDDKNTLMNGVGRYGTAAESPEWHDGPCRIFELYTSGSRRARPTVKQNYSCGCSIVNM